MVRTLRRGVATALVLLVLTATAALAHPSFNPNELPAGEAVDAVLVVPHGCNPEGGMPEEGAASPTILFDLQLTDRVVEFEAHEIEGWSIERISDAEVRWTATDGGTTDPIEFPVTITIDGPVGEQIHLSAFQECEQGAFRWIGTPDDEAEFPAVELTPTESRIGTSTPAGSADEDHADGHDAHDEEEHEDDMAHDDEPSDAVTDDGTAAAEESAEATADEGVSWVVVALIIVVLGGAAAYLWSRGSGRGTA